MILSEKDNIWYADMNHLEFFKEQMQRLMNDRPDSYTKALVYTLGICKDTRHNFASLYDAKDRSIIPGELHAAWQTDGSRKVTRLAFNLFTDRTVTAYNDGADPDYLECGNYSVSEIFCCEYAPLFVEAIKIRYPRYFNI